MLLLLISAKILSGIEDIADNNVRTSNSAENVNYIQTGGDGYVIGEPLWVLRLNNDGWMDPKLTLGTSGDQEDFYNAVAPMIGA
ncbi:unnamed protein product [Arctia plantaginis]|uniref:Uncharacterized protein n=1 Tax=Arctia plantaginis TaxID=874455 RepID=A0A8S0Z9K0_ARCPL|nr:unnamed protein product [Arctia plantaginis]